MKTHYCWERPLRRILELQGFTIHPEKSVLVPTQQITFLGFVIDSIKMTITMTEVWGKETIHLHALPEYPFKLPSNNQRTSANHRSDSVLIQSCSICMAKNVLQGIGKMQIQSLARSGGNFEIGKLIFQRKQQMN